MEPCIDNGKYRKFWWFSGEKYHNGHDYNCQEGTYVYSRWDGEVIEKGTINDKSVKEKQGYVVVKHYYRGRVIHGVYIHLKPWVLEGQKLKKGDRIGTVTKYQTKTWRADHLHHSIWDDGVWVKPKYWGYVDKKESWRNPKDYA